MSGHPREPRLPWPTGPIPHEHMLKHRARHEAEIAAFRSRKMTKIAEVSAARLASLKPPAPAVPQEP